jgi:hypothetical protein
MYTGSAGVIFGLHNNYYTYLRRIADKKHLDQVAQELNEEI